MNGSFFTFSNLSKFPEVAHGISPRAVNGIPNFNMSFEFDGTRENRGKFLEMLGGDLTTIISSYQTHSGHVYVHRKGQAQPEGDEEYNGEIYDFDAFVTDEPGVAPMVKTADCQSVLLYDPTRKIVGVAHSGWRGSMKNVVGKTVRTMVEEFECNPADLVVGVGPSLGPCCAEFSNPKEELIEEAQRYVDDRNHVDFWAMTKDQLLNEGVLEENIEFANECTVCHNDRWFSHRGDDPDEGRFAAVIGLR